MEIDQEKTKRVLDEINKTKKKTTIEEETIVKKEVSSFEKLTTQLMNMQKEHSRLIRQIRDQSFDVVEKLSNVEI